MGKALIIVDVQPTFCEGGELGVEGGNAVAERIAKYVESHRGEYAYIATTQDWHIEPGTHWSDNPDYVDTWPVHGKAGTANAELHPAIAALKITHHFKKGQYSPSYSGFEGSEHRPHSHTNGGRRGSGGGQDACQCVAGGWRHARGRRRIGGIALREGNRVGREKTRIRDACHRESDRTGQRGTGRRSTTPNA